MCGACADRRAKDHWSVALDSTRARWEVALLLNRALRRSGSPVTVVSTAGGWLVRTGTGRGTLADTVSEVWQLTHASTLEAEVVGEVLGEAATPVAEALWTAYCLVTR